MGTSTITNSGIKMALNRMYKTTPDYTIPSVFKIGTSQSAPTTTDTDLTHPIPISGTEQIDDCDTADWTDSADMTSTLDSTTFKQGDGSLALTKDATASALATVTKTTTSLDFTDKEFSIWLYIIDATALAKLATSTALEIRFGSDSSNYYSWTKDNADLSTGWNLIDGLTSSNATVTSSPTITACDYTQIRLTATGSAITWSAGDIIMDDLKLVSSDDYTKAFTSGYPILTENTGQAEIRCDVSSVEANGYNLSGIGIFNTDDTVLMESADSFTNESKSSTDEFIFTIKNRFMVGQQT